MLSQVNENLVNNIYNFRPAFNNVFEVYFIKTGLQREIDSKFSNVTAFTCSNVKFNGEDIDIKRHDVTKFFYVKDFKRQDQLELTFIETRDRIVRKYHEDWISCFYDRDKDCFKSYDKKEDAQAALYRSIKVKFPKDEKSMWVLSFKGAMIKQMPGISLKWGEPSLEALSLTYAVSSWSLDEVSGVFLPGELRITGINT